MGVHILDDDRPFWHRLAEDPATMIRVLVGAAAVLVTLSLLAIVMWFSLPGFDTWRSWLVLILIGLTSFLPGTLTCLVAVVGISLIRRLRRALATDLQEMAPTLRARLASRRPGIEADR